MQIAHHARGHSLNVRGFSHYSALNILVRPSEVRHIVPHHMPVTTEDVAIWLQRHLRVGTLRYISDPAFADIWQSPKATLVRGGGDCEDLAILTASVLRTAGVQCSIAIGRHFQEGHAWVEGVTKLGNAFLLEGTTGELFYQRRPHGYSREASYKLR